MEITVTKDNFESEILKSELPVLLDFWAAWCGPCRMLAPVLEELAAEYDGKALIGKVNVDEEGELAAKFGVMSIPTVVLIRDGKEITRSVGFKPKSALIKLLEE